MHNEVLLIYCVMQSLQSVKIITLLPWCDSDVELPWDDGFVWTLSSSLPIALATLVTLIQQHSQVEATSCSVIGGCDSACIVVILTGMTLFQLQTGQRLKYTQLK